MIKQNKLKKLIFLILLILFLILTAGFLVRNKVLNHLINNRIVSLEKRIGVSITYTLARFSGLSTINIMEMVVHPPKGEELLAIDRIRVKFSPLALLTLRLKTEHAEILNPKLTLWREGSESNYLFLLESRKTDSTITMTDTTRVNYKASVDLIFRQIFRHIPKSIRINNLKAEANIDRHHVALVMDELLADERGFTSYAIVNEDSIENRWKVKLKIQPGIQSLGMVLSQSDTSAVRIPYIQYRWGLLLAFDSLSLNLHYEDFNKEVSQISGTISTRNQVLNHVRISPEDVFLESGTADFRFNLGNSWVEIDSSTHITYNRQPLHIYARYDKLPEERVRLHLQEPDFDAATFFESLPRGLFDNLAGIKVKGRLSFLLDFDLQTTQPDSLKFISWLKPEGFSILHFGNTDFRKINSDFLYTAYEKDQAVKNFMVGPENPDFRRLDQISAYLKYAIMTSEDGAFFYHRGFLPDAIRESIVTNIKQKRFARGGSTISMQLVKNVFLTRNKTITRKVEEMLITWLIESQRISSKERMLEVYLNVIETGPMTYGVNQAAQFYFNKDVSRLSLAESIFIASIVPRPKAFKYSFDSNGNLREHLTGYYELVSSKMLKKEWITQHEYDELRPRVELKGPAIKMLTPADITPDPEEAEEDDYPDF